MATQTASGADGGPFSAEALETNRGGHLTKPQRSALTGQERAIRKNMLVGAGLAAVIGVVLLTATGPAPNAWARPLAAAAFFVGAVFCLVRALTGDALEQDLSAGRVVAVEGAIEKHRFDGTGDNMTPIYWLEVNGKRYNIGAFGYHAAPDAGWVRIYVLPHSKRVVNLERLPDKAIPAGALDSPAAMLQDFKTSLRSHNQVERAEARAEMQAIGNAGRPEVHHNVTPPAATDRDPRPLAEAILGTWRSGFISLTFDPDGHASMGSGSFQRSSTWSVDGSGKLVAELMGKRQTAEAWIVGDRLTISTEGDSLTLQRV